MADGQRAGFAFISGSFFGPGRGPAARMAARRVVLGRRRIGNGPVIERPMKSGLRGVYHNGDQGAALVFSLDGTNRSSTPAPASAFEVRLLERRARRVILLTAPTAERRILIIVHYRYNGD
jgi:hypothetical protein